MGNHPSVDLMVRSPKGRQFSVDVKGLYKKNFWVVTPKESRKDLYYVLAFVPDDEPNQFFILSQAEVNREVPRFLEYLKANRLQKKLSIDKVGMMPGLTWAFAAKFKDCWQNLPK